MGRVKITMILCSFNQSDLVSKRIFNDGNADSPACILARFGDLPR